MSTFPGSPRLLKGAIIGLDPGKPLASVVVTRTLVVLGQDLVPYRRRSREEGMTTPEEARPALRLNEAAETRRGVKRA